MSKSPMEWSVREVCEWLIKRGFGDYAESFAENQVNGRILQMVDDRDLRDLGVRNPSERFELLALINAFKGSTPAPSRHPPTSIPHHEEYTRQHSTQPWNPSGHGGPRGVNGRGGYTAQTPAHPTTRQGHPHDYYGAHQKPPPSHYDIPTTPDFDYQGDQPYAQRREPQPHGNSYYGNAQPAHAQQAQQPQPQPQRAGPGRYGPHDDIHHLPSGKGRSIFPDGVFGDFFSRDPFRDDPLSARSPFPDDPFARKSGGFGLDPFARASSANSIFALAKLGEAEGKLNYVDLMAKKPGIPIQSHNGMTLIDKYLAEALDLIRQAQQLGASSKRDEVHEKSTSLLQRIDRYMAQKRATGQAAQEKEDPYRTFSFSSQRALRELDKIAKEMEALEGQVNSTADKPTLGKIKTESEMLVERCDCVNTAELQTGKARAREERKQLVEKAKKLQEKIEGLVGPSGAQSTTPQNTPVTSPLEGPKFGAERNTADEKKEAPKCDDDQSEVRPPHGDVRFSTDFEIPFVQSSGIDEQGDESPHDEVAPTGDRKFSMRSVGTLEDIKDLGGILTELEQSLTSGVQDKKTLIDLYNTVDRFLTEEIDDVKVMELESGQDIARMGRKELVKRAQALLEDIQRRVDELGAKEVNHESKQPSNEPHVKPQSPRDAQTAPSMQPSPRQQHVPDAKKDAQEKAEPLREPHGPHRPDLHTAARPPAPQARPPTVHIPIQSGPLVNDGGSPASKSRKVKFDHNNPQFGDEVASSPSTTATPISPAGDSMWDSYQIRPSHLPSPLDMEFTSPKLTRAYSMKSHKALDVLEALTKELRGLYDRFEQLPSTLEGKVALTQLYGVVDKFLNCRIDAVMTEELCTGKAAVRFRRKQLVASAQQLLSAIEERLAHTHWR